MASANITVNVVVYRSNEEVYAWSFCDHQVAAILRSIGLLASNPELDFDWYDAAVVSKEIRERATEANKSKSKRRKR